MSGERVTGLAAIRQRAEQALRSTDGGRKAWPLNTDAVLALARDVLALAVELERLRKIEAAAKEVATMTGSRREEAWVRLDDALAVPSAGETDK